MRLLVILNSLDFTGRNECFPEKASEKRQNLRHALGYGDFSPLKESQQLPNLPTFQQDKWNHCSLKVPWFE